MTAAPATGRITATVRLLATTATLVGGEAILWRAGSALPSLPPDQGDLLRTIEQADPLAAVAGLLRLVALAAGAGLLAATALGLLARACGAARLVMRLDRCTPASLRRLLDGAVGAGLAASIGLSAVPAAADPGGGPPPPAPTLRRLQDAPSTTLRRLDDHSAAEPPAPPTTRRRLPDATPAPPVPVPHGARPAPRSHAARGGEVVVQPGDSFWTIAERHEGERLGRQPTEREVGACWQELVAVNRPRLAVPDDPDLLFPGQTLVIPCP